MARLLKHFPTIFFLLIVFEGRGQNVQTIGTPEEDMANAIALYNNQVYLLGTTRETKESAQDYYLVRVNEKGKIEKEVVFGGFHIDVGKDIIVNDDGIFILGKSWDGGYPNNDMFLHKLDMAGNIQWSKYYGGAANDLGQKFIVTRDGGFAMVGHNRSLDDLGDVYIVKANNLGKLTWENHFGGRYVDHGFDVIENDLGEFIIVGTLGGFYNPTTFDFLNHDADIFIIKTDAEGNEIWEKTFGGTSHDWAKRIIAAPGGGYYICGSTQSEGAGSFDVFLMKMDEDGKQLWLKTYGGEDFEYGEKVERCADGNLLILGTTASYSDNHKPDHLLIKTDLEGEVIWQYSYGGSGSDYSSDLACTPDSGCYFTGWTNRGDIGGRDIVLYKIDKNGDPLILSAIKPVNDSIEQIRIFPNPVKNLFSVTIDTELDSDLIMQIYDTRGAIVFEEPVPPNTPTTFQPGVSAGLYLFTLRYNQQVVFNGKLVFQ